MTITNIDRHTLRSVTAQFIAEVKDVADRLGLDISQGGGTYGGGTGSVKIDIAVRDTGAGLSGPKVEFNQWAQRYGIDPNAFGKTFIFNNRSYEVCGVYPSSPKYRFAAKDVRTGKTYKFTAKTLVDNFPDPMRGGSAA